MKYKLHVAFSSRPDMVRDAVESARDIGRIHLWPNNGAINPDIPETTVHQLPSISAISAINLMIQSSWDDDVMFWMHNDAFAPPGAAARLLGQTKHMDGKWGALYTNYDVLCAFNMEMIRDVGYWDPMFFQYTADLDFYFRMRLAGWSENQCQLPDPVEHRQGSITVRSDPLYNARVQWRERVGFDKAYYVKKWGGVPGHEVYKLAFNGGTSL